LKNLNSSSARRRTVSAAKFESACLQLLDLVTETGEEIVVTRGKRPVAMLVPVTAEADRPFVGRSRAVIHATRDDLLAPVGEDWRVDTDL
jgi:antitoxin (DNA-binding transcriptional repressor) of toxin-antitoxin stability system